MAVSTADCIVYVLTYCEEEPQVIIPGLRTLYNLCYRCESGQEAVLMCNIVGTLKSVMYYHSGDPEVMKLYRRLELALRFDGWRGYIEEIVAGEMSGIEIEDKYLQHSDFERHFAKDWVHPMEIERRERQEKYEREVEKQRLRREKDERRERGEESDLDEEDGEDGDDDDGDSQAEPKKKKGGGDKRAGSDEDLDSRSGGAKGDDFKAEGKGESIMDALLKLERKVKDLKNGSDDKDAGAKDSGGTKDVGDDDDDDQNSVASDLTNN